MKKKLVNKYRRIRSIFFTLLYGSIKGVEKKSRSIKSHKILIQKTPYNLYELDDVRVYSDSVNNTAFIRNDKIIDGPSFQIKNLINTSVKENVVFKINTPRFIKKFDGSVLSLLSGGAGKNNYWHWMFDVLPRLNIANQVLNLKKINYFMLPEIKYNFQIETLKILGLINKSFSGQKYKHVSANKIYATNHPWQRSKSAHKDIGKVPKWISLWLRNSFLKYRSKKNFFPKIYIDRSDSTSNLSSLRKIINEDNVKSLLKKYNFKFVKLSEFNIRDQIQIFNKATVIVGNHGAGFTNLLFSKKKTKVIEFRNPYTSDAIKNMCYQLDLIYFKMSCKIIGENTKDQNSNIKVDIKKLEKILKKIK